MPKKRGPSFGFRALAASTARPGRARADSWGRDRQRLRSESSQVPSRTDPEQVALALTAFVNTNIMSRGHPIQPDDDLEAAGVDSMALLKILLFVEAEFGFWMPDEDLVEENVVSSRALANYICRRRKPS